MKPTEKPKCGCPACDHARTMMALDDRLRAPGMSLILTRDLAARVDAVYARESALLARAPASKAVHGTISKDRPLLDDMAASRAEAASLVAECEAHLAANRAEADRRYRRFQLAQARSAEMALRLLKVSKARIVGTLSPAAEADVQRAERALVPAAERYLGMRAWEEATADWFDRQLDDLEHALAANGF